MLRTIPHQCGDAIAAVQSRAAQSCAEGEGTRVKVAIGVAMGAAFGQAGNNLDFGKELARALQERSERERILHYGAEHGMNSGVRNITGRGGREQASPVESTS